MQGREKAIYTRSVRRPQPRAMPTCWKEEEKGKTVEDENEANS